MEDREYYVKRQKEKDVKIHGKVYRPYINPSVYKGYKTTYDQRVNEYNKACDKLIEIFNETGIVCMAILRYFDIKDKLGKHNIVTIKEDIVEPDIIIIKKGD